MRSLLVLVALSVISLSITSCNTESRHRIIVYDQSWSNAAGVKNLVCSPEMRASCEREARESESDFSKRLPAAFRVANECKTVQFIVSSDDSKELEDSLTKNVGSRYWILRVDFHPRLENQPYTLGSGRDTPLVGGDDAEHNADFICRAAKHNGVIATW
jgi:hypothetical protein